MYNKPYCASADKVVPMNTRKDLFDEVLAIPREEYDIILRGPVVIDIFVLNPRRIRGSDFLMRWSQGRWSEHILLDALNNSANVFAIPYGPSSVAPSGDIKDFETYFLKLEKAGLGKQKRPDILVFCRCDKERVEKIINALGGVENLPFIPENDLSELLYLAILGIECENSLWIAQRMPHYNKERRPKKAIIPTIIVKEEDVEPLRCWEKDTGLSIHIWHAFFDIAFGIAFDDILKLIDSGEIRPETQVFFAPSGPTTRKKIYKIPYNYGYEVGHVVEEAKMVAKKLVDKNGHVLPYVHFEGGRFVLSETAQNILKGFVEQRRGRHGTPL
ncbi:MAG: AccI family restriction endonuclease [Candidatus Bathyarchaeia archaeon]